MLDVTAFSLIGTGRHRLVYAHGRFVVKVPASIAGFYDNTREARISAEYGRRPDINGISYARCHLLCNGWLVMERVEPLSYREQPKWACYVDCAQVGRTRDGRVVAYDYGY